MAVGRAVATIVADRDRVHQSPWSPTPGTVLSARIGRTFPGPRRRVSMTMGSWVTRRELWWSGRARDPWPDRRRATERLDRYGPDALPEAEPFRLPILVLGLPPPAEFTRDRPQRVASALGVARPRHRERPEQCSLDQSRSVSG